MNFISLVVSVDDSEVRVDPSVDGDSALSAFTFNLLVQVLGVVILEPSLENLLRPVLILLDGNLGAGIDPVKAFVAEHLVPAAAKLLQVEVRHWLVQLGPLPASSGDDRTGNNAKNAACDSCVSPRVTPKAHLVLKIFVLI